MFNELMNNVKKRLAINALTHASKQYDELPEESYHIKKRGIIILVIAACIYLGIDYFGSNGIEEDLGKSSVLITTLVLGGLYGYMWTTYFYKTKQRFLKILNIDIENQDLLISHFDNVIFPALYGRRVYGIALYGLVKDAPGDSPVEWDDFSIELSNQEIETLMSQQLNDIQKNYIADMIFKDNTLNYIHLQGLQNIKDVEINEKKEECLANFLKERNIQSNGLTKTTANEIEYEYKKIL